MTEIAVTRGPVDTAQPVGGHTWSGLGIYLELAKFRLCLLVLVTTLVGYVLAAGLAVRAGHLAWTMLGTALAALGANALNQCVEVARDAQMLRTRGRPLPSGRLRPLAAWTFAVAASVVGPAVLALAVTPLSGGLAVLCVLTYVLLYTPLKLRTPLNTLVGAVVGAIPPMIGWSAATGRLDAGAWTLAAVLFLWQIPHFLSLAWVHREDYARGGFRVLPVVDPAANLTCYVMMLYSAMLLPVGTWATLSGLAGSTFAVGALLLTGGLLALVWRLHRQRTKQNARRVFVASIAYLPLLLGLMVADRGTGVGRPVGTIVETPAARWGQP